MSKFILLSIILTTTAFSTSKTMASGPNTVSCTTCQSETDFWTYGAGHIEDNYGGAFAAFTSNDRIIVRNSSGTSYMIEQTLLQQPHVLSGVLVTTNVASGKSAFKT
jgi:hypothetical protein